MKNLVYTVLSQNQNIDPFKSTEECWNEMQKHQPFGWMKTKSFPSEYHINNISKYIDFSNYFNVYTFVDGSPFRIKEN